MATNLPDWMNQPPPSRRVEPMDAIKLGRPSRRRSSAWPVFAILGAIVPLLFVTACCALFAFLVLAHPNNAKCPGCGKEFYIPEDRRIIFDDREYRCPQCGYPAEGMLFRIVGRQINQGVPKTPAPPLNEPIPPPLVGDSNDH